MTELTHTYILVAILLILILIAGLLIWQFLLRKKSEKVVTDQDENQLYYPDDKIDSNPNDTAEHSALNDIYTEDINMSNENEENTKVRDDETEEHLSSDDELTVETEDLEALDDESSTSPQLVDIASLSINTLIQNGLNEVEENQQMYEQQLKEAKSVLTQRKQELENAQAAVEAAEQQKDAAKKSLDCAKAKVEDYLKTYGNGNVTSCCTDS